MSEINYGSARPIKGGIAARRKAKDRVIEPPRQKGVEVKTAVMAARMVRRTVGSRLPYKRDRKVVQRLNRELMRVIRGDIINPVGYRNADDGAIELLEGFEFNETCKMSDTFLAPYTCSIDRVDGTLTIRIAPFIPANCMLTTGYATHFKLVCIGAAIDFKDEEDYDVSWEHLPALSLNGLVTKPIEFVHKIKTNNTSSMFLALGIQFYQLTKTSKYHLYHHVLKSLAIVKVSGRAGTEK
jgi:hypothetical protein